MGYHRALLVDQQIGDLAGGLTWCDETNTDSHGRLSARRATPSSSGQALAALEGCALLLSAC